jgi:AcrR family transcriptional regulator
MGRWKPNGMERLQGAAMTLFHERGYANVTIADITGHAGLTKRSFFNHFPDKREVLFAGSAALEEAVQRYIAEADTALPPIAVAMAALIRAGEDLARYGEFAPLRRDVIASSPELQERSLIKMASLAGTIATALQTRDVDKRRAELVAHTAVTIFSTAYDEWTDTQSGDFAGLMGEMLTDLSDAIDLAPPDIR